MTKAFSPFRLNGLVRSGPVHISDRSRRLILAMIDAGLKDQQIHAFFSQPGRDFNHNQIAALRHADRNTLPSPASATELQNFLDQWVSPLPLPDLWIAWTEGKIDAELWRVEYRFHPVGQGMLHSGLLQQGNRLPFTWIYDCGSVTAQALVEDVLNRLHTVRGGSTVVKPTLDLVALSHFDKDHVSGIVHLLGLFQVKMILLPFLPLWQRLWIAASAEDLDAEFLQFLVDPAGYLLTAAADDYIRVVFVPPSNEAPPPTTGDDPVESGPRSRPDDRPLKIRLETERRPDLVTGEIDGVTGDRTARAEFLKQKSTLDIDGLWEFVPYNDARQSQRCPRGFSASVDPLIKALLNAATPADREMAFAALKRHYDGKFGASGYRRNIISLFFYGGPVPDPTKATFCTGRFVEDSAGSSLTADHTELSPRQFAMLFTGDGSLNSKPRRTAFSKFFQPHRRLDKTAIFQVMHHGASGNSSPEVAALVAPLVSIFCSNPMQGEKHPDGDVLRQFWPYNCVQVDDSGGWLSLGLFEF